MDPVSILKAWVEPITGPLQEMRRQVEALSSINQSSVKTFQTLATGLTDSYLPNAFTGPGANAMSTLADDYVTTETSVADTATFSVPIAEAVAASDLMDEGILEAIFTAASEVTDAGPLEAVTATVDIAAGAQGGIDVPNDVAAVGVTGVDALGLVVLLVQFFATLLFLWRTWQGTLDGLSYQHYPELPERPQVVQPPMNQVNPLVEEILQMEEFKSEGFDPALIEELYRLGYSKDEIIQILRAIKQNKSYLSGKPDRYRRAVNFALQALVNRSISEFASGAYRDLRSKGFTDTEIRTIITSNGLSLAEVLTATEKAQSTGLYQNLKNAGLTEEEIHYMLGTMTKDDMGNAGLLNRMQAYLTRLQQAQANGHDQQGLTEQQLHDLLFHPDQGIISTLLSGDDAKIAEGKVAISIIEEVTLFNIKYGPNGSIGQIDVGTNKYIIEVKKSGVTTGVGPQIRRFMTNDTINPVVNGQRKKVVLFARDYDKQGAEDLKGKYDVEVVRLWNDLRKYIGLPPLSNQ